MSFKSHIYDRQEIEESTTNWPLFILPLLTGLLGYLLTDINGTLGSTIMVLSTVGMYFNLYKDWGKKEEEGKYIGEIILTEDIFTLDRETFKTTDIKNLKIEIGYTKGYKHWHRYGYTIDSGTRSSLEFTITGLRRHYNFQIFSDRQVKDLKMVLEGLYEKGIFVKEFYLGERTYLLDNLDYEDIQEFKKKYKLV
jgi:hypothetical protein